ncbi:MAG: hypothetical protein DHS20C17_10010 [Cyclobacteriaceae bacterium]|nr:MAG: hypothetical protein DHS20C17_10010 [Cyclobacteriaceae bacterium]
MNLSSIDFGVCDKNDLNQVLLLLKANNLPTEDLSLDKIDLLVARSNGAVIGCIGLEKYHSDGLLRSFAVQEEFRNSKIGATLYSHFLSFCLQKGISTLHLLTETADSYFLSKGFQLAERARAPKTIQKTTEFSELCPSTSSYMVNRELNQEARTYLGNLQFWQKEQNTGARFWAISGNNSSFTYFEVPPSKTFPLHQHHNEQITHVLEGKLFFEVNGQVSCLGPGDSIVIPANIPHKVWTEKDAVKAVDSWAPGLVNW